MVIGNAAPEVGGKGARLVVYMAETLKNPPGPVAMWALLIGV